MDRATAGWFFGAGLLALSRWVFEAFEPEFYDPDTLLDHSAVLLQSGAGFASGVALLRLWRKPPVRRGSVLLLVAGAGIIVHALGNLFEDSFGIEEAVWAFFGGGIVFMLALVAAGIAALTVPGRERWSGIFLVAGVPGGMLGFGLAVMGVAWIGLGVWILWRLQTRAPAPA